MKFRFNGKDRTRFFKRSDIMSCTFECVCACTGVLFFIPLVSAPESKYGRYWANQGLLILIIELMLGILAFIGGGLLYLLSLIKFIGILFSVLRLMLFILLTAVAAVYISYAIRVVLRHRAKDIPFVGYIRLIK